MIKIVNIEEAQIDVRTLRNPSTTRRASTSKLLCYAEYIPLAWHTMQEKNFHYST